MSYEPDDSSKPQYNLFFQGEFGFELTTMLPYAYYLHTTGQLNSTLGCGSMAPFYFFSPHHTDLLLCHRSYGDSKVIEKEHGFPLWWGAWSNKEWARWIPPPLRLTYQQMPLPDYFPPALSWSHIQERPVVVIINKYTIEWDHAPSNFLDRKALNRLLSLLTPHFTVVYNRPLLERMGGADDQMILDLDDHEFVASWKDSRGSSEFRPIVLQDLPGDINLNQLFVYSRCTRFIAIQGGPMVLPTYFGGLTIVYHKEGRELTSNAYENSFPRISGSVVMAVHNYEDLAQRVSDSIVRPFVGMQAARSDELERNRHRKRK